MAVFSGLGTGAPADPFQITTVSQFKEMNSTSYLGNYFLLMNDLDFESETGVSLPNFCCNFDGGGHTVDNIELFTGGLFTLSSWSSVKNVKLVFDRFYSADSPVFVTTQYRDNVTLNDVEVVCKNTDGPSAWLCNVYLNASCVVDNITATGNFSILFSSLYCNMNNVRVYNSNIAHVPLIGSVMATLALTRCIYIKPFTVTTKSGSKGLFINTASYKLTIVECAVIVNEFEDLYTSSHQVGGFIGNGQMDISNSYVIGLFNVPKGNYMHALYGGYSNSACTFTNCYFYGDLISNVKADTSVVTALPSTGCYYCKELLTNQAYGDSYATNLTVTQFKSSVNFGFGFASIWQQGVDRPLLQGASEALSQFDPESLLDTGPISIGAAVRISGTEYSVEILTDNTKNFGVDIVEFEEILDSKQNESGTLTFETDSDIEAIIKTYYLIQGAKLYTDSKEYYHVHLDQIEVTDVTVDKYTQLKIGNNVGAYIHGSILVGDYLYGSSRNNQVSSFSSIVKALASDVSQFQLFPIKTTASNGSFDMDSLVKVGDKLYTVARDGSLKVYMIVFDLLTNDYQSYLIGTGTTIGAPSCTDGQYIYVYLASPYRLCKIGPAVFNSTDKYNTSTEWPINSVDLAVPDPFRYVHTVAVDGSFLYVGLRPSGDTKDGRIWKVDKDTMTLIQEVAAPPMTDDMCQTDTHLFVGVEARTATSPGYNVGCCAIRKSDLNVTTCRKLHTTDTAEVKSYASLIFGNFLVELKTNSHIYALDISNPDAWENDDMGAHTLRVYKTLHPDGVTLTKPINEVYLTESGKFVGFAWDLISFVTSFDLPGLNYFAAPTVITGDAAIIGDDDASISGYITSTGGKTVTAVGVTLGQAADLSDGVDYPVTPVTTEFEKAFNDLEYGTYYFRVYATNAEGTGYGVIKSFTLEIPYTEPGQPTDLDKAIQAEITINWTAPVDDGGTPVTGYKIERKASDGDWAVIVADTGSTATTYTETLPQGAYQYRVSAITAYTPGQPSAILDVNAVVGGGGMYRIYLGSTEIATIG